MRRIWVLAFAAAGLSVAAPATAQDAADRFPNRAITIIIPASPGGAIDITARLIGPKLTEAWGQPVVIENKSGATGIIGTDALAKSAPDGHMLVLVASSHAINPSMFKTLPYDTLTSFEPVVQTHVVPLVLVVSSSVPATSLRELIAYGKANPSKMTFASSGQGGAPHMSAELFRAMAGIEMTHVPYRGSTAAHPDLRSGRISLMFDTVAAIGPLIQDHSVKPLAVTTAQRSAALPDVPTMAEAGMPGYETSTWGGILAPAGTPKAIVAKLNAGINQALADNTVRAMLAKSGIEVAGGTPEQFGAFIQAEMAKWAKVAATAGIKPE